MNTLEIGTMPDYVAAVIVGLLALMVTSFGYMIYLAITAHKSKDGNEKKGVIASFVISISFVLCAITGIGAVAANRLAMQNHEYDVVKTEDTITIESKSAFLKTKTFKLIAHKDGTYYLKDKEKMYELPENELN